MSVELAGITLYDLKDLAARLDVSVPTLRSYIEHGRLQARKVGRSYRVTEEALRAFLQPLSAPVSSPGAPEDDPILQVAGIGEDGMLTRDIDRELYGQSHR